jgi:Ca2+-binding EF-hand superfamily protein
MFVSMDKNKKGKISMLELDRILKELGIQSDQQSILQIFYYFDKDEREYFNYSSFMSLVFYEDIQVNKKSYPSSLNILL